jgi:hypothetical protein
MKLQVAVLIAVVVLSVGAYAQVSAPAAAENSQLAGADRQSNAASETKDNSSISGDQITQPAGGKSSTVIGCLTGPDSDGHFNLKSMQHRLGVEVVGPNDLRPASGKKVKLHGKWEAAEAPTQAGVGEKELRRFQATSFDVMADTCSVPAEVTPVSKKKQQQEKAAAAQNSSNNPK